MKRTPGFAIAALLCMGLFAPTITAQQDAAVPQWYQDHIAFMTQKSGRWTTDNSAYKSENEPFDAYGTEWKKGIGGKSLKGRLFGLKDGKEVGNFWEFRVYWHPGEKEVRLLQLGGDGTVGFGTVTSPERGKTVSDQEFLSPDGGGFRVLHESDETGDGVYTTGSFDAAADGTKKLRRTYTWRVQP